jgi:hypothetical protein
MIAALLAVAALSAPCRADKPAEPGSQPGKAEMKRSPKVASRRIAGETVQTVYADGTTETKPIKRVAMPAGAHAAVRMLVARKALCDAVFAAADLGADAGPDAQAAALGAAAKQAGKKGSDLNDILKGVGLLAAGAAAGAAANNKPKAG